jgi:hypothetical protein
VPFRNRRKPIARMDIEELQKKVVEFRDARDWAQIKQMSEDGGQRSEENHKSGHHRRRDQRTDDRGQQKTGSQKSELQRSEDSNIRAGDQQKDIPCPKSKGQREKIYRGLILEPGFLNLDTNNTGRLDEGFHRRHRQRNDNY